MIKEGGLEKDSLSWNSVYVIYSNETAKPWYVGITMNYSARKYVHQNMPGAQYPSDKYTMIPIYTGLSRQEARIMEEILILTYASEAALSINNSRHSIAESKQENLAEEFQRVCNLFGGLYDPF